MIYPPSSFRTSASPLLDSNAIIVTRACVKRIAYSPGYLGEHVIRRRSIGSSGGISHDTVGFLSLRKSPKSRPSQEITACIIYQDPKCWRPHHLAVRSLPTFPLPSSSTSIPCVDGDEGDTRRGYTSNVKKPAPVRSTRRNRGTLDETARAESTGR